MAQSTQKVELFVNFLYPGIILKGDSFTADGSKIGDANVPFEAAAIEELKKKGVQRIYYTRPVVTGKTVGKKMMVDGAMVDEAFNVSQEVENAVKSRAILPQKEIDKVIGNFINSISAADDDAILNLMDIKDYDDYTYTHSVNVSLLSILFAKRLGYNEEGLQTIGTAALLHDIGKTMVPKEITNKPLSLNEEEFAIMKKHPIYGYEIIKGNSTLSDVIQKIVLLHHEQVCGKGYPFGFRGEQMGEAAQIVSIADTFDAMTAARSYKPARPFWYALREIAKQSGYHFVPRLAMTFVNDIPVYLTEGEVFRKGSYVILNSGEMGEVIDHRRPQTLYPTVNIYINAKKEAMRLPIQVNLEYDNSRSIEYVVEEKDIGIFNRIEEVKAGIQKRSEDKADLENRFKGLYGTKKKKTDDTNDHEESVKPADEATGQKEDNSADKKGTDKPENQPKV
jgi:putative nucleotidyltransferase with HDIG domain